MRMWSWAASEGRAGVGERAGCKKVTLGVRRLIKKI
jgi:hypothetical protein